LKQGGVNLQNHQEQESSQIKKEEVVSQKGQRRTGKQEGRKGSRPKKGKDEDLALKPLKQPTDGTGVWKKKRKEGKHLLSQFYK